MTPTASANGILETLNRFQRRAIGYVLLSAIGWMGTALVLILVAWVFSLGWWGGTAIRILGAGVLVMVVSSLLLFRLILPLRSLRQPVFMAQQIGRRYPAWASSILTAFQLSQESATGMFLRRLVTLQRDTACAQLQAVSMAVVLPVRPVYVSGLVFLTISAAAVGFVLPHAATMHTGLERLLGDQRVPDIVTLAIREPVMEDLDVRLRYPEYLNRQEQQFQSVSGGIEAPVGTTVVLQGRPADGEALDGNIHLSSGETRSLRRLADGSLAGSFVVDQVEWFSLSVNTGNRVVQGPARPVVVEPDQSPSVRLLRPTGNLEVAVTDDILLEFEAHDDHGILRVDLVITGSPDLEIQRTILHASPKTTRLRSDYRWSASSLQVEEISEIALTLRVYDDDTIRGPKFSTSETIHVQVMTEASRRRDLLQRQSAVLDALVDLLAFRLEKPVSAGYDKAEEIMRRFRMIREQTEDALSQIARLMQRIQREGTGLSGLAETYSQIREDLGNQILFEAKHNELPLAPYRQRLDADKVTVRLLQRAIIHVDNLILDQQFQSLSFRGHALAQQQETLRDQILLHGRTRGDRTRRAVLEVVRRMENTLNRLLHQMGEVRGQVPDATIAGPSGKSLDLHRELRSLREVLAADDIEDALVIAQSVEQSIAHLLASLESGHLTFKTDRFGEEDSFVDNLLSRVGRIESSQMQLRRETLGLQRRYRERLVALMQGDMDRLIRTQQPRVRHIRELIETHRDVIARIRPAAVPETRDILSRVETLLRQGDLDRSVHLLKALSENLAILLKRPQTEDTQKIRDILQKVNNVSTQIEDSFPKPGRVFSNVDKRTLRNQSFQQRYAARQATRLHKWIQEQESRLQFISSQSQSVMKSVENDMRIGARALEERNLEEALRRQTLAIDSLIALRQSLRNDGRLLLFQTEARDTEHRIHIPRAEDFEVHRKHRQEILDAMKASAPEVYREAIERYYATLVR